MRNPYDMEVSRYHYLRRGYHGVEGAAEAREQEIALAGDFERFALEAPYHGQLPANIERWYQIGDRMPQKFAPTTLRKTGGGRESVGWRVLSDHDTTAAPQYHNTRSVHGLSHAPR